MTETEISENTGSRLSKFVPLSIVALVALGGCGAALNNYTSIKETQKHNQTQFSQIKASETKHNKDLNARLDSLDSKLKSVQGETDKAVKDSTRALQDNARERELINARIDELAKK